MSYTLSVAAKEDIFDIALYTAEQWGAKQTRTYTEQLADCMEKLAAKQGAFKQLTEFNPQYGLSTVSIITYSDKMQRIRSCILGLVKICLMAACIYLILSG